MSSWPELRDGRIPVVIDLRLYRLEAIQKAAYRMAERLTAVLGKQREHDVSVEFVFRATTSPTQASESVRLFFQELLDQELREKVAEETRAIRSLILAQAFSRTDLIKRDE